jgi:hypothetical protein
MAKHKVVTTSEEIDRALLRAKTEDNDPRAVQVEYRPGPGLDLLILKLSDGQRLCIPRENLQGLQNASKQDIANIEILGKGTGLHWPALDVDLYVPALLRHVYGNRSWMAKLGRRGGKAKSPSKAEAARANGAKGGRPKRRQLALTA